MSVSRRIFVIQTDSQLVSSIGKLAAVADIKSKADTTHSKKLLNGA